MEASRCRVSFAGCCGGEWLWNEVAGCFGPLEVRFRVYGSGLDRGWCSGSCATRFGRRVSTLKRV